MVVKSPTVSEETVDGVFRAALQMKFLTLANALKMLATGAGVAVLQEQNEMSHAQTGQDLLKEPLGTLLAH
jgi:hypothetical protein